MNVPVIMILPQSFLERECSDADGLVISVDMLLYGGLVPSRIHHDTEEGLQRWLTVLNDIRKKKSWDYVSRRQTNRRMNEKVLEYVEQGAIDFLVIPQDDSAVYGYAAMDQETIREKILKRGIFDKVGT